MTPSTPSADATATREGRIITVTRYLAAPPERVFQMFTDPDHLAAWWGPDGFTITTRQHEFRPGGIWDYTMHGPDGTDYLNYMQYSIIEPGQRLAYRLGERADDPNSFSGEITVEAEGPGTRLTMRLEMPSEEACRQAVEEYRALEGGIQTLGRLAEHLEVVGADGEPILVLTRILPAPPERVFRAWTEPEQLMAWWGPIYWTTPQCTVDLRVGGRFHLLMQGPEGPGQWIGGEYRVIDPPHRLVVTDYFADEAGNKISPATIGIPDFPEESVLHLTFMPYGDNQTIFTLRSTGSLAVARKYQAPVGWNMSLDKLAALVAGG